MSALGHILVGLIGLLVGIFAASLVMAAVIGGPDANYFVVAREVALW